VIAYLLKPQLFSGRNVGVVVDIEEGAAFGQTRVDGHDSLNTPGSVFWVENGDAEGFFDLLTERLARLK
jgi:purine nucleosidase